MNPFDFIKNLEHHAYFLHSIEHAFQKLADFLNKEHHIVHKGNPDFYYQKFETLSIDDSRNIKELHSSKSFTEGGKRIFVIEANGITHEAQNSLLKIFEEPHEHTHFFLIMPSVEVLLPTLRSRLLILQSDKESDVIGIKEAENFITLSKKEKIEYVDELAERISDEKATKNDAQKFLAALEVVLYKKGMEKNAVALKAILKVRDYMNDRGASVKQLLEFVALNM